MVLFCILQDFRPFLPSIWPSFEYVLTAHGCIRDAMPVEYKKSRKVWF